MRGCVLVLLLLVGGVDATNRLIPVEAVAWGEFERIGDFVVFLIEKEIWITVEDTDTNGLVIKYQSITSDAITTDIYTIDDEKGTVLVCSGDSVHVYQTNGASLLGMATVSVPGDANCTSVYSHNGVNSFLTDKGAVYTLFFTSYDEVSAKKAHTFTGNYTFSPPVDHAIFRLWYILLTINGTGDYIIVAQNGQETLEYPVPEHKGQSLSYHHSKQAMCARSGDITSKNEITCFDVLEVTSSGWSVLNNVYSWWTVFSVCLLATLITSLV